MFRSSYSLVSILWVCCSDSCVRLGLAGRLEVGGVASVAFFK
ncbi:hypothetical protein MtrunA17_Chr8g0370551 [Medicago truncatula]|uniref:Uncharacterized protein n=1 Tax=Medicago truncatula TaxID=3880 RepID=A0A396GL90_MEDTR|nr:hypothetical protein MtrunA17_Chr8g0370551 [Medicago truncatula]